MKFLAFLPILAIALVAGCIGQAGVPSPETGTLQIKITDQAQELQSLVVTVDSVEVHRAFAPPTIPERERTDGELSNDTAAAGWVTVVSQPQTVDLVQVRDIMDILGEAELEAGFYTQVRMRVSSAIARIDGAEEQLVVPSKAIKFVHPFRIEANKTTSLVIDFYADYAIEMLPAGKIFSPVATITTEFTGKENAEAERIWNEQAAEARRAREKRAAAGGQPSVAIVSAPPSVPLGEDFEVVWRVDSPVQKEIAHTAVHYGANSIPGVLGTEAGPAASGYQFVSLIQKGTIPGTFTSSIGTRSPGTLYFRAHAIIDGNNYWSPERSILVTSAAPPAGQVREFTIEADDREFSPAGPFAVSKGDTVRMTFKVRTTNVRFGGLEIRSSAFNTGKISPGGEKTVEFTAQDDFSFTSYWPNSNVAKATAGIDVQ